jgi:predicted NBD/HSP70 family sugar kinase
MVLELFRELETLSIPAISERTALSKTTVGKIIDYFLNQGIISGAGKGESTLEGGKRPELFQLKSESGLAIGIHVHHLQLYAVLTDLKAQILHSITLPLKNDESEGEVIKKIKITFNRFFSESKRSPKKLIGVGLGFPAIANLQAGIIRTSPWFPSWGEDLPFQKSLEEELNLNVPVIIDNECRFQVFAEKERGMARNRKNIIAIYIRAGIVAGIMINNEIKRGVHYLAGEIGHMVINPLGPDICNCGSRGCFEAMVYENRLLKKAIQAAPDFPSSLIFQSKKPEQIIIEDIFYASNNRDELAVRLLDDIIDWFAIAFSNIIMMIDPEIIVIQGIYAKAGDYFLTHLREKVNKRVLPRIKKEVEIEYSNFGPEVFALGAALLIISDHFKENH